MKDFDLLAAHMVGDYILQTNEEAMKKTMDVSKLLDHCFKYTLAFLPFVVTTNTSHHRKVAFLYAVFVTHILTDQKRWASGEEWPPKPILVDQALHAVQLAILRRIL